MKMQSIVPVEGGVAALTRRIAVPVTALLLIGLVVILFVMWSAARDRDDVAATASLRTARSALNVLQEHLGRTISDYAIWDESMQHLHVAFDPAWASQNVGRYVAEDYHINTVLVISPSNQVVFAFEGNAPAETPPMFRDSDPSLQRLVAAARSATADEPRVTGFIRQNGRVHVAAASVINWYEDTRKIPPHTATVLVFARDFEPPLISEITDNYELPGLRIAGEDDYRPGELVEALNAFGTSQPLGFVLWRPDLPGSALLRQLAAPVGSAITVMVVLLATIMLNARRAGHALDAVTAELRASREHLESAVAERTAALQAEVHERRQIEAALRTAEKRYRSIFENALEGIFQMTRDGRYLNVNPALATMLGFTSPQELLAAPENPMFATPEGRRLFFTEMDRSGFIRDFICEARRRDGSPLWVSQHTRAVSDGDGRIVHYEGMVVDITARKSAEERLIHQALHDPLTGLPNRSQFLRRLQDVIEANRHGSGARFALLFIDCDRFKVINDSLGHLFGDRLLVILGHRIASCLRKGDTLARLGADEFAVLIEDVGPDLPLALAQRLHDACRRPIDLDDRQVFVSISIGINWGSAEYEQPGEMLRDAHTAMFRAKGKGHGATAVFESGMHREAVSRLLLETELRQALERGELRVHYQPRWALAGRTIAGFEALVRWQHNGRGLVPPSDFIPIAEETGLIVPLGHWVMVEACRQLAAWRDQFGASSELLFMSVNLAPAQLNQSDLVEQTADVLDRTGLSGEQLKLEITETAMMADPKDVQAKLTALHRLGIRLCIDDFGTGYSSLSQLHTYPFDTLKIDRSFIARIAEGRESVEMVRTILLLGRNLRLSLVAEGVETALQCDWLLSAGCTYAQGYFLSPPLEAQAIGFLLRQQASRPRLAAVGS